MRDKDGDYSAPHHVLEVYGLIVSIYIFTQAQKGVRDVNEQSSERQTAIQTTV